MDDRPRSDRPKSATTKKIIKKVKARIRRNPRRSGNEMAKELEVSRGSISNMLHDQLPEKCKVS